MYRALENLDALLSENMEILIGGGAAMVLAYHFPLSTLDIDGLILKSKTSPGQLDRYVKKVATDLKIHPQWFNSYFNTYTYTVPPDFKTRFKKVFSGKRLIVYAMGLEDLLIMKCFAGREKDVGHAKGLIKKGANLRFVDDYLQSLASQAVPGSEKALDFLDDIKDQLGV